MEKPNFLVIGTPKSGTTSLYYYLEQHPDVYLPDKKELHYYSYPYIKDNSNGIGDKIVLASLCSNRKDYENNYKGVRDEKAVGEISPSYLFYSDVAARIKDELGIVKIIVILRNPIEKAYSQYIHLVRDQREHLSFYDALLAESERRGNKWGDFWLYAFSSLYSEKLKVYQSVFGVSNVKVILFEDFTNNTDATLEDIFRFLGVNKEFKCNTEKIYNKGGIAKSKIIAKFFSEPNLIRTIAKQMIPKLVRRNIRLFILNLNIKKSPEIDSKSMAYLVDYFQHDVTELEKILQQKIDWLD